MHFAAHGHTAAEVIYDRADAEKDFMGLITWRGAMPTKHEAEIAKNYLSEEEVDMRNRIVNLYLDFAEFQAKSHVPMCKIFILQTQVYSMCPGFAYTLYGNLYMIKNNPLQVVGL